MYKKEINGKKFCDSIAGCGKEKQFQRTGDCSTFLIFLGENLL
jgi:hypothetical protein